jgi:hypothetical protein
LERSIETAPLIPGAIFRLARVALFAVALLLCLASLLFRCSIASRLRDFSVYISSMSFILVFEINHWLIGCCSKKDDQNQHARTGSAQTKTDSEPSMQFAVCFPSPAFVNGAFPSLHHLTLSRASCV